MSWPPSPHDHCRSRPHVAPPHYRTRIDGRRDNPGLSVERRFAFFYPDVLGLSREGALDPRRAPGGSVEGVTGSRNLLAVRDEAGAITCTMSRLSDRINRLIGRRHLIAWRFSRFAGHLGKQGRVTS